MKERCHEHDLLMSRVLDGEASPSERRLFFRVLRRDAALRAEFAALGALDAECGAALRGLLGRRAATPGGVLPIYAQCLGVAASVALAAAFWLHGAALPAGPGGAPTRFDAGPSGMVSWFAPLPDPVDAAMPVPAEYERPVVRTRDSLRDWIVIPGEQPGEYLLIEVEHQSTRSRGVFADF